MPEANGRRRGMGSPEPTPELAAGPHRSRDGGFLKPELTRWRLPEANAHDRSFLRHELSEGLPVPREPAYDAKRSHDGEAPAASE